MQWDASVSYDFSHLKLSRYTDGLSISVGVSNAFNANPPLAKNANPNTYADDGYYGGAVGILTYTNISYKF